MVNHLLKLRCVVAFQKIKETLLDSWQLVSYLELGQAICTWQLQLVASIEFAGLFCWHHHSSEAKLLVREANYDFWIVFNVLKNFLITYIIIIIIIITYIDKFKININKLFVRKIACAHFIIHINKNMRGKSITTFLNRKSRKSTTRIDRTCQMRWFSNQRPSSHETGSGHIGWIVSIG